MAKIKHQTARELTGWAFISPWVIGFLVFVIYPICYSLYLSFFDVTIGSDETGSKLITDFVGFAN